MGQTYSVFVAGGAIVSGSRAMPHLGQGAGLSERTSGSMGQMYEEAAAAGAEGIPSGFGLLPSFGR